ncbi:hypothetical protein D3C71_2117870 [compost metagenome]
MAGVEVGAAKLDESGVNHHHGFVASLVCHAVYEREVGNVLPHSGPPDLDVALVHETKLAIGYRTGLFEVFHRVRVAEIAG